uniref:Uncharacterized protein n=1 Tax=Siphoviridae sp. ct6d71 TaxID=2826298 RepID=A0A8S5R1Q6_9CAUD|nr:MAG TPA: hypothetical protein [Siphoviridae sp. ct6d71]
MTFSIVYVMIIIIEVIMLEATYEREYVYSM